MNKSYFVGNTIRIIENQAIMQNIQAIYKIDNLYLSVSYYEDRLNSEVISSIYKGFQIIKEQFKYIKNNYP